MKKHFAKLGKTSDGMRVENSDLTQNKTNSDEELMTKEEMEEILAKTSDTTIHFENYDKSHIFSPTTKLK